MPIFLGVQDGFPHGAVEEKIHYVICQLGGNAWGPE